MNNRTRIAITMGDPAGIGSEVIVKALSHLEIYEKCIPVVIGDRVALEDAVRFCNRDVGLNEVADVTDAVGLFGQIDYIKLAQLGCRQLGV